MAQGHSNPQTNLHWATQDHYDLRMPFGSSPVHHMKNTHSSVYHNTHLSLLPHTRPTLFILPSPCRHLSL